MSDLSSDQKEILVPCSRCGASLENGSTLCRNCGFRQTAPSKEQSGSSWWKKVLAPMAFLLIKGKSLLFFLLKFKFFLSFFAFFGVYWALYGIRFGFGFAVSILIHELGHFVAVKRLGMKAELPVFLPGMGAFVRWEMARVGPDGEVHYATLPQRAAVALAGPFAGLLCAVGFLGLFVATGRPVWSAVAHAGAWLNLINLVPLIFLDGARATEALNRLHRGLIAVTAIVLGVMLSQGVYFFVALGMGWRLFTQDLPEVGSNRTMIYFMLLLFALGVLFGLAPARAI